MYQVSYFLTRNASSFPDRLAVASCDETLTWSELNEQSTKLANALLQRGIKKGDRLAIIWENSTTWMIVFYACQKLGVAMVPLNPRLLPKELNRIMNVVESTFLFVSSKYATMAQGIIDEDIALVQLVTEKKGDLDISLSWDEFITLGSTDAIKVDVCASDESIILFTSGTTGRSKGVVRTQGMVRDHALVLGIENRALYTEHEVMLTTSPLDHAGGLLCAMKMASLAGTMVLIDSLRPQSILQLIDKYRVTQIFMAPPLVYARLVKVPNWHIFDLTSIKDVLISAGSCQQSSVDAIYALFPKASLRVSWGSTETCSPTGAVLSRHQIEEEPSLLQSVGTLNPLVEVRLVGEAGEDVDDGSIGEAWVRSPMVCSGYLGDSRETFEAFEDGWFKTGDLLRRDERGYFYFVDRKKDVIKTGGENVYAQEVEQVILRHPSVLNCAVVAIPDKVYGEGIAVAMVLKPGLSIDGEELVSYSKKHLPSYKKPRYFATVDQLPVSERGKIRKDILRDQGLSLFQPLFSGNEKKR